MSTVAPSRPEPDTMEPQASALVLKLGDTTDVDAVGGKAAALSAATRSGLPVLPGFVLATAFTARVDAGADLGQECERARRAWTELTGNGKRPLVVRSSSPAEDTAESSMAGRFESVVGVRGWDPFVAAVGTVLDSRVAATGGVEPTAPIAVLVQPLLSASAGGVLSGVDPVTGRSDRLVVAAVRGLPDPLVSGEVPGTRYTLTPDGQPVGAPDGEDVLGAADLRALAMLARQAEDQFGGPQDLEWALDAEGRLWLLQSRPVTVEVRGVPTGPVLGPGPVAETFPEPLAPLEVDLWVPPLRDALREALLLTGARAATEIDRSPVVAVVNGQVALDLELISKEQRRPSFWARLDPRPRLRRARAAWRVGRLRAALPTVAGDVLVATDTELAQVPELATLSDRQLLALLTRAQQALRSLHAHELLVGQIVNPDAPQLTGTSVALRLLAHARGDGLSDVDAVLRYPVVLALTAPHVTVHTPLPATPPELPAWEPPRGAEPAALLREALRLRVRWVQELSGRAAWELGERLAAAGRLDEPARIREYLLLDVTGLVRGASVPSGVPAPDSHPEPLPARFRLSDTGRPIPVADGGGTASGAGGGRAPGRCTCAGPTRPRTVPCWSPRRWTRRWPRICRGWPAWSPRPAACSRTWPSWPARPACRRWLAPSGQGRSSGRGSGSPWTGTPARCTGRSGREGADLADRDRHARGGGRVLPGVPAPVGVAPRAARRGAVPRRGARCRDRRRAPCGVPGRPQHIRRRPRAGPAARAHPGVPADP